MIEGIPRISVYIITYNQEDVIERTLASILSQRDYVYEICVSDDCSTDRTWEILNEYSQRYPGLFKLNRNEPNLGIFENTEKVWTMPTGDIVYDLAGDDRVGDGFFSRIVSYISENEIDYKHEAFAIYGDYLVEYPNGDSKVCHNSAIAKYPNKALRLAMRGIICNRGVCYSIRVLHKFEKVSQGRSHIAEDIQDRMLQIYAENNYYIPVVGNVYVANIGVSAHLTDEAKEERKQIQQYTEQYLGQKGVRIKKSDSNYGKFRRTSIEYKYHRSFSNLIKILRYAIASFDFPLSFAGNEIRTLFFAIIRRMPHKTPIHFK